MWIEISKDVFEESDIKGLNYIFQILSWFPKTISRYNVFINLDEIKHTDNYKKIKLSDINFDEYVEQQFNDFILSNPRNNKRDFTITNKSGASNFNIEEAIRYFNQPLSIVLENNKNDAYFIKALFCHFDSSGVLSEYVENGWIKFENAGGCTNVKNFIEGELKSFEDLASRNNRNPHDYYRGFIFLDSDKEFLSQPQKNQYNNLIAFFNAIGIDAQKYHVLEKRMMENYMPDEVFKELKDLYRGNPRKQNLVDWINAYLNLSHEQKDFLNIKSGFSKETDATGVRKPISLDVLNLFAISAHNLSILDGGFKFLDFKNLFSELFYKSTRINKTTMLNRSNSNEFNEILGKLNKLL